MVGVLDAPKEGGKAMSRKKKKKEGEKKTGETHPVPRRTCRTPTLSK